VRDLAPKRVAFNKLIGGYCKVGEVDRAYSLKERMKRWKLILLTRCLVAFVRCGEWRRRGVC
jgi:pentatricopeptide repeat protein